MLVYTWCIIHYYVFFLVYFVSNFDIRRQYVSEFQHVHIWIKCSVFLDTDPKSGRLPEFLGGFGRFAWATSPHFNL